MYRKGPIELYEIPIFLLIFCPVLFVSNYENDTLTVAVFLLSSALAVFYVYWLRRRIFPRIGIETDIAQKALNESLAAVNDHKWIGYIIISVAIIFGILLYEEKYDLVINLNSYLKTFGLL
jgi:hypothetical protein